MASSLFWDYSMFILANPPVVPKKWPGIFGNDSGLKIICIDYIEEMPMLRRSIPFMTTAMLIAEDNLTYDKLVKNHNDYDILDRKIHLRRRNTYQNHMLIIERELNRRFRDGELVMQFENRWYIGADYIKAVQEAQKNRVYLREHYNGLINNMQYLMKLWDGGEQ